MARVDSRVTYDDRVWQQLRRRVRGIATTFVKVGIIGAAAEADHGDLTNAEIGAIHEYGAPRAGIPQRSWLRATFDAKLDELRGMQARVAKALLAGTMTLEQGLGVLGAWGAGAVRRFITSGQVTPRLEESAAGLRTIARKGSSKTLVDTAQLVNSISWGIHRQ